MDRRFKRQHLLLHSDIFMTFKSDSPSFKSFKCRKINSVSLKLHEKAKKKKLFSLSASPLGGSHVEIT